MSSFGLNIGLKALLSSQSALETIGHNVSNANTPGYSRQRLQLVASPAVLLRGLAMGSGVDARQVLRTTDLLIERRIAGQQAGLSALDSRLGALSQVEALLGETGGTGIGSALESFYASLSRLAADPGESVLRTGVAQSAGGAATQFNQASRGMASLRAQIAGQAGAQVAEANALAESVVHLNREISRLESTGVPANDLRDRRDATIRTLASLIDVSANEGANGMVTLTTGGQLLVGPTRAYRLSARNDATSGLRLELEGRSAPLVPRGGSLAGLLRVSQQSVPAAMAKLDALARGLILEMNRAHSTGLPASGPFSSLTGQYAVVDSDGDGSLRNERLSTAGLPFAVRSGELHVNVTDRSTGAFTTWRIPIDGERTTVGELLDALDALPHVSASLDPSGRVQILAEGGWGFDFSSRLNPAPDVAGTFGGTRASLGSAAAGPFALSNGATLDISGPAGSYTVNFSESDFASIGAATAEELAAVINAQAGTAANGLRAVAVNGRLALQTVTGGAAQSLSVSGGSALAAFGWSAGQTVTGQDQAIEVQLSGTYSGQGNQSFTFVPSGDGTIGTTAGLKVDVFDAAGRRVASLDVGEGYVPGTPLDVADGLRVSFGLGVVSRSDNDAFAVTALADADTSDVLVALGLNAFFTGTSAADIAVRADIAADPGLIAGSGTGASLDNRVLLAMAEVATRDVADLGGVTLGEFHAALASSVGFEISAARDARDTEQYLLDSLVARREGLSGVNVDEELVSMIQFQQAYGAAARFIEVINRTQDELLRII